MTKKEFIINFCIVAGGQDCRNYSTIAFNTITAAENIADKLCKLNYLEE